MVTLVIKLNPIRIVAIFIRKAIPVRGHDFIDYELADIGVGAGNKMLRKAEQRVYDQYTPEKQRMFFCEYHRIVGWWLTLFNANIISLHIDVSNIANVAERLRPNEACRRSIL
jgi:hypothetical protein